MAKTYIDTVKYIIYADVDVDGMVDKPDVVGAIFGQTEGLLGEELDLRDLQKNGRIGRIEVDLRSRGGRTKGVIKVPSSLDMVETCIIGAAIETVERVGPCEASILVNKVEDTRNIKREHLIGRSKLLLRTLINTEIPESQEISDMVREEVKAAEIGVYGRDKLPAGPAIARSESVILVEGRADVVNLLKKDMPNVVAIGGAKVPRTIVELSREKESTVFLDGDRGGDMILRELLNAGVDIDFLARAPAGKEVEELTRKEIMKCLKNKLPFEQEKRMSGPIPSSRNEVMPSYEHRGEQREQPYRRRESMVERVEREAARFRHNSTPQQGARHEDARGDARPSGKAGEDGGGKSAEEGGKAPSGGGRKAAQEEPSKEGGSRKEREKEAGSGKSRGAQEPEATMRTAGKLDKSGLENELKELSKTLKARFYDKDYALMRELPVREVIKSLEEVSGIHAIVFDGIVTQRLVDLAESKGVEILVGGKMGNVSKKPAKLELLIPASRK